MIEEENKPFPTLSGTTHPHIVHSNLSSNVTAAMSDAELSALLLRKKERPGLPFTLHSKIAALLLWFVSFLLFTIVTDETSLLLVEALSTLGLVLVLLAHTAILSSMGAAAKFSPMPIPPNSHHPLFHKITKPTPPIVLALFGWLLLFVTFIIYVLMYLAR